jgi:hypothetical protein
MTSMSAWARLRAKISMRSLRTRRDAGARSGGGSETGPAWRSAERGTTRRTSVGSTASRRRRKTGAPR